MKLALIILIIAMLPGYAQAVTTRDFAKLPAVSYPRLSPDGNSIAFVTTLNDRPTIITKDLVGGDKARTGGIPLTGLQLNWFDWANNERLVISARVTTKRFRIGKVTLSRFISINRDGTGNVLFAMEPNKWGYHLQYSELIDMLPDDPQHVLMTLDHDEKSWGTAKVHKVNIYTGEKILVEPNHKGFLNLISDNNGEIRIGERVRDKGKTWSTYIKINSDDNWALLQKASYFDIDLMRPVRFDYEDNNILLFTSREIAEENDYLDENFLYRYDLRENKILGPHLDKVRDRALQVMETKFPNSKVKLISYTDRRTLGKAFYKVYSDVKPPQYFLYDINKKEIKYSGSEYPQLHNTALSEMQEVNYAARDGTNIPAFLTIPEKFKLTQKPKLPTVIYPHGGPWARNKWGFDNYVQFFAHEGYVVFQPQFRGSTGQGIAHEQAGYKQWGLAIQNDITDGVKWLIANGLADPDRICIVGGSFGGYAAAMGLATTPELYRCGISINGVMDMPKLYSRLKYFSFYAINKQLINKEWGIKKVSPLHLAKNIVDPLLLIAGENDAIVDKAHSEKMFKKLTKLKKPTEYLELPKGEHWRTIESNEILAMETIQRFLQRHLGDQPIAD